MGNAIVILVILAIVAGASAKIIIDKKNGVKCAGCPHAPSGGKGKRKGQQCGCNISSAVELKVKL